MRIDAESALASLLAAIAEDANPGTLSMHLGHLASSQWHPYTQIRDDWASIYNMWLLLAEQYRLESFWSGSPAFTGFHGRSGSISNLLQYACFGIWCKLWDRSALVSASRTWCELELASLKTPIGPSASVVDCFMADMLTPTAGSDWAKIRRKFSRGGMRRPAVHSDFYPYGILAPELAWYKNEGQTIDPANVLDTFPPFPDYAVTPVTERALMAVATSQWG